MIKRPLIIHGIVIAFLLTLVSVPLARVTGILFRADVALKVTATCISFFYLLYLFIFTSGRRGKIFLGGFSFSVILLGLIFLSPLYYLGCLLTIIWFTRSLLTYQSLISIAVDFLLSAVSLFCFFFGLSFYSLSSLLWCFFLLQAVSACIPRKWGKRSEMKRDAASNHQNTFDEAHRAAERALKRIVQQMTV